MRLLLIIVAALAGGLLAGSWQRAVSCARSAAAGDAVTAGCQAVLHRAVPHRAVLHRAVPHRPGLGGRGWLVTGLPGRWRQGHGRAGPPAAVIESCTAALIVALALRLHPGLVAAAACWLAVCAVPLAWIDASSQRLPDVLTIPACAGTLLLLTLAAAVGGDWPGLLRAALGGSALAGCYLAANLARPDAVGRGDAKLSASLGALLGWVGWSVLAAGVVAGFMLAAVYGIAALAARRASLSQRIPFGPFMIAGAFLVLLLAGAGSG